MGSCAADHDWTHQLLCLPCSTLTEVDRQKKDRTFGNRCGCATAAGSPQQCLPLPPPPLRATLSGDDASLAAPTRSPTAVGRSFGRTALDACSRPTQRVYPKTAGGASASPPPHMSVVVAGARGPENTHAYDSTDVRTEFARLHAASHAASCGHAPPRLAMSPLDSPVAANQAVSPTTSEEQRVMPIL
jgi:hypothetical protein